MDKLYLGRVCVAGLTKKGDPAVLYAVSGRSEPSRQRRAKRYGNIIKIEPNSEAGVIPEDKKKLIIYNAIMAHGDGFIVCTNGEQTDYIFKGAGAMDSESMEEYIREGLDHFGHEPDPLNTPRIGLVADNYMGFCMGIVQKGRKAEAQFQNYDKNRMGEFLTIRTYQGDFDNPVPPKVPRDKVFKLEGNTPEDLAVQLFEEMEKYGEGLTVATAAAIWVIDDSKDWELDVKNRKE